MVTGLCDSSIWEIGSAGYIWTSRHMQRRQRHRTERWMDRNGGVGDEGSVGERRNGQRRGWGGGKRGRIRKKQEGSTVSGETTNKGKSHATYSLSAYMNL